MSPDQLTAAAGMIYRSREPVLLYVRRIPGLSERAQPTTDIPTGPAQYVIAGRFDENITLEELRIDLNAAEAELTKATRRAA